MSKEFPYPCSRCGFCCLVETCPVGKELWKGVEKVCPSLKFEGDLAFCKARSQVGNKTLGIGQGCCMEASISFRGKLFDFACQATEVKIQVVRQLKREKLPVIRRTIV